MQKSPNKPIALWLVTGLLAYLALPWYAIQDTAWYSVWTQIFGGAEAANGLVQVWAYGRVWLALGLVGLVLAGVALLRPPGRAQSGWLLAGGLTGFLGLLVSGFTIGARGWSYAWLNAQWGELGANQYGIGAGAFVELLS